MVRRNGERGPYKKRSSSWCVWCGEPFETNHGNATTCTPLCRSRLAAFRRKTGFAPEDPVGEITAEAAYLELVARLVEVERDRQEIRNAAKTGDGRVLGEVVRKQEAKKQTTKRAKT